MEISGFLYSQIGYDMGDPMRALIRSTKAGSIGQGATFEANRLEDGEIGKPTLTGPVRYWGEVWHSHWWEIDFSGIAQAGTYEITVSDPAGERLYRSDPIPVDTEILWNATVEAVAIEQFEHRAEVARNRIGWKDCGAEWRECNSHASAIIGLNQVLSVGFQWLTADLVERLTNQIIHGCDYLGILQDTGQRIGAPDGAFVHEIPNHLVVIPGDTAQSVVALAHAGRLLADTHPEKGREYVVRAGRGMNYLLLHARPSGGQGFSTLNHGAPEDFVVPPEFMTRDLAMMMWGCLELYAAGCPDYQHHATRLAREVMARQVPRELAEGGTNGDPELYGHFYTFASARITEKANCHHGVGM
ncbi:MAG: hypothetical protein E4H09_01805, partial [Spirochaetales bacterium]